MSVHKCRYQINLSWLIATPSIIITDYNCNTMSSLYPQVVHHSPDKHYKCHSSHRYSPHNLTPYSGTGSIIRVRTSVANAGPLLLDHSI